MVNVWLWLNILLTQPKAKFDEMVANNLFDLLFLVTAIQYISIPFFFYQCIVLAIKFTSLNTIVNYQYT